MAFCFQRWHLRQPLPASSKYLRLQRCKWSLVHLHARLYTNKATDPLRILFCGSDELSVTSLQALHREHVKHPEHIASIDVVSRPGKRVGRGLKVIRQLPITIAAEQLALPLHTIDTFTNWVPPEPFGQPIDLVIAVSFGLLVPPRILSACRYGGINVHPSLLPDLRGPAPLQHTLMLGRRRSGVTVQTLHPRHFDRGQIIAQTPYPGIYVPGGVDCTYEELRRFISPICADMLLEALRQRLFVPPIEEVGWAEQHELEFPIAHASKITSEKSAVEWDKWDAETIVRHKNALGDIWDDTTYGRCTANVQVRKRIVYHKIEMVKDPTIIMPDLRDRPGSPVLSSIKGKSQFLLSTIEPTTFIRPISCTIEGKSGGSGYQSLLAILMKRNKSSAEESTMTVAN